jgi:hypothetical protein
MVAEVVHGTPTRFSDPARYSFAHGGKDGHPFPVPLKVYDHSISVLRRALDAAKVGATEKLDGFKRLDQFTRRIEEHSEPEADFEAVMEREHAMSQALGGRSVTASAARRRGGTAGQMTLFPLGSSGQTAD